ncbi:MAG: hypothetical protein AABW79_02190 [Nanoarchaeota archaeon]
MFNLMSLLGRRDAKPIESNNRSPVQLETKKEKSREPGVHAWLWIVDKDGKKVNDSPYKPPLNYFKAEDGSHFPRIGEELEIILNPGIAGESDFEGIYRVMNVRNCNHQYHEGDKRSSNLQPKCLEIYLLPLDINLHGSQDLDD